MPTEIDLDELEEEEKEETLEEEEEETSEPEPETTRRKKRDKSKKYELYEVRDENVKRLRKSCPRCGPGIFMGDHGERLACGKCGYTEFKNTS